MARFAAPPGDDLALLAAAKERMVAGLTPDLAWPDLVAELGIDLATAIYVQKTRSIPANASLLRHLEEDRGGSTQAPPALILVPGFLHEGRPELGADGALVEGIAGRLGIPFERVPTLGRAPLSENAASLRAYFAARRPAPAWVLTLSKGTSDFAWALRSEAPFPWGGVVGWVNLCGSPQGSPLVSAYRRGWRRGLGLALRWGLGVPRRTLVEMDGDHLHWQRPLVLPAGVRAINLVACPLRWHLGREAAREHALLAPLGPNDGVTLCHQAEIPGGETYPVWGADHYFRGPQVVPLLYRLLRYLCIATPS